jgi:hypothetical protein
MFFFQARKSADDQLARRISDPGLRAWLLMNLRQHPETRHATQQFCVHFSNV